MKAAKKITVIFLRIIYFIPVLVIVSALVLFLGRPILGPGLPGSDNANFVTQANWLLKWFPRIPFWFPQEGGGMSFTASYPILNHLVVVILQKLSGVSIVVVFRIWSLITVVLTSVGLYLLAFRLTKNQTVSALTAIFYPLLPITWIFMLMWGFSAEQLSYVFVPPVLIFLSLFLDEFYLFGLTLKSKIYFLILIIANIILVWAHPSSFVGIILFTSALFVVYPIFNYKSKGINFKKTIVPFIVFGIIICLSTLFWFVPFEKYYSRVAQGYPSAASETNYVTFLQNAIFPLNVFNITDKNITYKSYTQKPENLSPWAWRNVDFPFIISLLALVGLIGSFFINRKIFAFGIANLFPLTLAISPQLSYYLTGIPLVSNFSSWIATITPPRFIIPLLAGFGCYAIVYPFTYPLQLLSKKIKNSFLKFSTQTIFVFLSAILTLAVAGILLWNFKSWPFTNPGFLLSLGTEVSVPSEKVDLRNIWKSGPRDLCYGGGNTTDIGDNYKKICANEVLQNYFLSAVLDSECRQFKTNNISVPGDIQAVCDGSADENVVLGVYQKCSSSSRGQYYSDICQAKAKDIWQQLSFSNWQKMIAATNLFTGTQTTFNGDEGILKLLPNNPNIRVDVGTSIGAFMMIEPFYSNVPELPVYYNQATLIDTLWNYEIGIFNQKKTVWPEDSIMSELSKYFGLGYMVMSENLVPVDKYIRTGWERVYKVDDNTFEGLALWKFNQAVGLLNVSTKPTVLVIGQDKVDGYFRVFHLANLGTISFDNAILVKGGSYVDDYSPDDLKQFDIVILEGYAYKNQANGWKILDSYIKGGGSLLINNGWQYSSADWNVGKTPAFFPMSQLSWTDLGNATLSVDGFSPLKYGNSDWFVSSGDASNLRSWAKVFLSAGGNPVIAGGQYGKGRVVWMGLDLSGHIGAYQDNSNEVKFYGDMISYLLKNKTGQTLSASLSNSYPDRFEIDINSSTNQKVAVYLSEAYYPDFKAKLVSGGGSENIKSYKAGPGMTLFILPGVKSGLKIIYEYKTPFEIIAADGISLFTLLGILAAIICPQYLVTLLKKISGFVEKGKFKRRILGDEEDSDY